MTASSGLSLTVMTASLRSASQIRPSNSWGGHTTGLVRW
jgi:hypothetical protein